MDGGGGFRGGKDGGFRGGFRGGSHGGYRGRGGGGGRGGFGRGSMGGNEDEMATSPGVGLRTGDHGSFKQDASDFGKRFDAAIGFGGGGLDSTNAGGGGSGSGSGQGFGSSSGFDSGFGAGGQVGGFAKGGNDTSGGVGGASGGTNSGFGSGKAAGGFGWSSEGKANEFGSGPQGGPAFGSSGSGATGGFGSMGADNASGFGSSEGGVREGGFGASGGFGSTPSGAPNAFGNAGFGFTKNDVGGFAPQGNKGNSGFGGGTENRAPKVAFATPVDNRGSGGGLHGEKSGGGGAGGNLGGAFGGEQGKTAAGSMGADPRSAGEEQTQQAQQHGRGSFNSGQNYSQSIRPQGGSTSGAQKGASGPGTLHGVRDPVKELKIYSLPPELQGVEALRSHFSQFVPNESILEIKLMGQHAMLKFKTPNEATIASRRGRVFGPNRVVLQMRYAKPKQPREQARVSGTSSGGSSADEKDYVAPAGAPPATAAGAAQAAGQFSWEEGGQPKSSSRGGFDAASKPSVLHQRSQRFGEEGAPRGMVKSPSRNSLNSTVAIDGGEKSKRSSTAGGTPSASGPTSRWDHAGKDKRNLSEATALVGTCLDMCPEKERYDRETQRDLSIFEILAGTENPGPGQHPRVDHNRAVKKYARSAAFAEAATPEIVRPPHILKSTMEYLLKEISDRQDVSFVEVHNFLRDRTRSIRQDFTYQGIRDALCVELIEQAVRFHILSEHRLCEEDAGTFSSKQNIEQLDKCLISLREMYSEHRMGNQVHFDFEAEIQSYFILTHSDPQMVCTVLKELPRNISAAPVFMMAVRALSAKGRGNYIEFFRIVRAAPYLTSCLLHMHFTYVRINALKQMRRVYRGKEKFPIDGLVRMLCFNDEDEAAAFCRHQGFGGLIRDANTGTLEVDMSVATEESSDRWQMRRSEEIIEAKRGGMGVSNIMRGELFRKESTKLSENLASRKHGSYKPADILLSGVWAKGSGLADDSRPTALPTGALPPPFPRGDAEANSEKLARKLSLERRAKEKLAEDEAVAKAKQEAEAKARAKQETEHRAREEQEKQRAKAAEEQHRKLLEAKEASRKREELARKHAEMKRRKQLEEAERQRKAKLEEVRKRKLKREKELAELKEMRRQSVKLSELFSELLRFKTGPTGPLQLDKRCQNVLVVGENYLAAAEEFRLIRAEAEQSCGKLEEILSALDTIQVKNERMAKKRQRLLDLIVSTINRHIQVVSRAKKSQLDCLEHQRRKEAVRDALFDVPSLLQSQTRRRSLPARLETPLSRIQELATEYSPTPKKTCYVSSDEARKALEVEMKKLRLNTMDVVVLDCDQSIAAWVVESLQRISSNKSMNSSGEVVVNVVGPIHESILHSVNEQQVLIVAGQPSRKLVDGLQTTAAKCILIVAEASTEATFHVPARFAFPTNEQLTLGLRWQVRVAAQARNETEELALSDIAVVRAEACLRSLVADFSATGSWKQVINIVNSEWAAMSREYANLASRLNGEYQKSKRELLVLSRNALARLVLPVTVADTASVFLASIGSTNPPQDPTPLQFVFSLMAILPMFVTEMLGEASDYRLPANLRWLPDDFSIGLESAVGFQAAKKRKFVSTEAPRKRRQEKTAENAVPLESPQANSTFSEALDADLQGELNDLNVFEDWLLSIVITPEDSMLVGGLGTSE